MSNFYNYDRAKEYLTNFCKINDVELIEKGEVSFGRSCVGIFKDGSFVGYNSFYYNNGKLIYYFKNDKRFENLRAENAYSKCDCFAVICEDDVFKYRNAVIELANWIYSLEKVASIKIKTYESKSTNAKVFFTGNTTMYEMVLE